MTLKNKITKSYTAFLFYYIIRTRTRRVLSDPELILGWGIRDRSLRASQYLVGA